ncbi:hypothetical protein GC175_15000 [bacterium]|nr:hypothetical protein [bacterium]
MIDFSHARRLRQVTLVFGLALVALMTLWWHYSSASLSAASSAAPMDATPSTPTTSGNGELLSLAFYPEPSGQEVTVYVTGLNGEQGVFYANLTEGPGIPKHSWTAEIGESETAGIGIATLLGFVPEESVSAALFITSTENYQSEQVEFNRVFVPRRGGQSYSSPDGDVEVEIFFADTFNTTTYLVLGPTLNLPGPLPAGYQFVLPGYNIQAPVTLPTPQQPFGLRFALPRVEVVNPHRLVLLHWQNRQWQPVDFQQLFSRDDPSAPALFLRDRLFGIFTVAAENAWRDTFDSDAGISAHGAAPGAAHHNITVDRGHARLTNMDRPGVLTSTLISLPTDRLRWESLTFAQTVEPASAHAAATLQVDILAADGTPLALDVKSGDRLSLPPVDIRLRATLTATVGGESPTLSEWRIGWTEAEHQLYLPITAR